MAVIRSLDTIRKKWQDRTSTAGEQYAQGVSSPRADWAGQTAGAQANWEAGVTAAAQAKSFSRGAQAAGTAKWQSKAVGKGAMRFGPGVQDAGPEFQAGFEKYRAVIEQTNLPPRFATGDPRNVERVRVISQALRKAKTGR